LQRSHTLTFYHSPPLSQWPSSQLGVPFTAGKGKYNNQKVATFGRLADWLTLLLLDVVLHLLVFVVSEEEEKKDYITKKNMSVCRLRSFDWQLKDPIREARNHIHNNVFLQEELLLSNCQNNQEEELEKKFLNAELVTSFICADKTVEVLVPLGVNKRLNYSLSNRNTQKCCNVKRYQES